MPGIAPRFMAWDRRMGGTTGPLPASGEAGNDNPVLVELLIGGAWTDITPYVMVRDNNGNISLTRGRRDEGSTADHATCRMTLNNRDGRFSPRNPTGPYFGLLGRNQPVRISVPNALGGKSYRFQGEISVWPQSWDPTGTDIWTEVEGSGILRRLSQGPPPARSVLFETLNGLFNSTLLAYWPMEDATGSATLATPLASGSPMTYTGSPTLASYSSFLPSDPVPSLTGSAFTGAVAQYSTTGMTGYQMRFLLAVPSSGLTDLDVISRMQVEEVSAGASLLNYFDIHYNNPPGGIGSFGGIGTLTIQAFDGDEATVGSNGSITMDTRGRNLWVSLENEINGTTLTATLRVLDIDSGVTDSTSMVVTSTSLSRVKALILAADTLAGSAGVTGASAGHLALQNGITPITVLGHAIQLKGEVAGRRIERVCSEEGIAFEAIGNLDETVAMGIQDKVNPLDVMRACELADDGMLYETMSTVGLGYRPRTSLLNQDAQLTLSYTGFNLSEIPTPVEDDQYIENRVTVTVGDISQTYSLTTGTLSTQVPPTGVGVYGTEYTLDLKDSSEALNQAAWRVHVGTVDEPHYPQISVNLAHSSFTSNPALKQAVLGLRQGDRILVQNPPSWLPPGDIDQIIIGFEETITRFEHRLTFVCTPASPYRVGILSQDSARIDTDGSELVTAIGSSDTSMVVTPSTSHLTLWTKDAADMPFDVRLGGEVVRVTAVADWLTDTFTRSESNGWGTSDTGFAWSTSGGSASDYSVNGSNGVHVLSTVDVSRRTTITAADPDFDVYCDITTSALATGDSLFGAVTARMENSDNFYMVRLAFTTANQIVAQMLRSSGGLQFQIGDNYTLPDTHVAGTFVRVRFQGIGSSFKAKVFMAAASEPSAWNITGTDTAHSSAFNFGTRSIRITGNTNAATVEIQYDNYTVVLPQTFTMTRSINSVTKSQSAGADIRLATPTITSL